MTQIYPVEEMDLPELELLFAVLSGIRLKYRSQSNRFITLGIWPKLENVSHNDLIHIIGRLSKAGIVKRHTGIGLLVGLSISITDAFEPFYDWVQQTIEFKKTETTSCLQQTNNEPLIYKSFDPKTSILVIGGFEILIAKRMTNNKMHEIMKFIFIENQNNLTEKFYYSEICDYITEIDESYNSKIKDAHAPYSSACNRINDKIKDATNNLIYNFFEPNYSNIGFVTINQKYLN